MSNNNKQLVKVKAKALLAGLKDEQIKDFIAKAQVELEFECSETDFPTVLLVGLHMCMNGPFGLAKDTTVSGIQVCLRKLVPAITKAAWVSFCKELCRLIKNHYQLWVTSNTVILYGDLLPLARRDERR